jgi:cystathionine beta-lyase family protein involved in aluminum resistance
MNLYLFNTNGNYQFIDTKETIQIGPETLTGTLISDISTIKKLHLFESAYLQRKIKIKLLIKILKDWYTANPTIPDESLQNEPKNNVILAKYKILNKNDIQNILGENWLNIISQIEKEIRDENEKDFLKAQTIVKLNAIIPSQITIFNVIKRDALDNIYIFNNIWGTETDNGINGIIDFIKGTGIYTTENLQSLYIPNETGESFENLKTELLNILLY